MTVQFETIPTPKGLGDQYYSCEPSVITAHHARWLSWARSNTSVLKCQPLKFAGHCCCCEVAIPAGQTAWWGKVKDGTSMVMHANGQECVTHRDRINPTRKQVVTEFPVRPTVTIHRPALKIRDHKLPYGLMVIPQPPTLQRGNHKVCQTPAVIYL